MANLKDRPYIGTWALDGRKLVQHTPDALVYVNGSVTLPGCRSCDGRINLQQFVTEVSVESGVDPAGASASFTLSIPMHSSDAFARDAKFLLHPGLEVHIYERGYFPVKGLYSNLAEPLTEGIIQTEAPNPEEHQHKDSHADHDHSHDEPDKPRAGEETVHLKGFQKRDRKGLPTRIILHESGVSHLAGTETTLLNNDTGVHYAVGDRGTNTHTTQYADPKTDVLSHTPNNNADSIGIEFCHQYYKDGTVIDAPWFATGKYAVPAQAKLEQLYRTVVQVTRENGIPMTFGNVQGDEFDFGRSAGDRGGVNSHRASAGNHFDGTFPLLYMALRQRGHSPQEAYQLAVGLATAANSADSKVTLPVKGPPQDPGSPGEIEFRIPEADLPAKGLGKMTKKRLGIGGETLSEKSGEASIPSVLDKEILTTLNTRVGKSLLERFGLSGMGVEDVASYPYYHVFHGVVIDVGHSWSGGMQTVTVQCKSMLHFWEYHKINSQAAIFQGSQVENSGVERSIKGHNFTDYHPYMIMYRLHQMTMGAQNAVGGAFSRASNLTAVDPGTGRSLHALTTEYWDRRFNGKVASLRMHGVSGEMYSTLQAAYLSRNHASTLSREIRNHFNAKGQNQKLDGMVGLNLSNDRKMRGLLFSQSAFSGPQKSRPPELAEGNGGDRLALNMAELKAFHFAAANIANFGLFEATYQSKLDVAQKVMEITGFEFYQDVDGDLVFKPPMWNLDTSSSRVYRIEDIDIINISFNEKEPQCTYTVVKGNQFASKGMDIGVSGDEGKRAVYVDYRLVAQFGYRPFEFETTYLDDVQSMFYMGVARMDVINAPINSANVTIPLRPELRPGFPVYIPYLDCYYYIQNMAHGYTVGGQCSTTLTLVAKRAKFYAPGDPNKTGIDAIDLADGTLPLRPLEVQAPDGTPRLSGFPNVVMALDPNRVNPMYYPTGASISRLETPKDFRDLLQMSGRGGIGILSDKKNGTYTFDTVVGYAEDGNSISKEVTFYFGEDVTSKDAVRRAVDQAKQRASGPVVEVAEALREYANFKANAPKNISGAATAKIASLDSEIVANETLLKELSRAGGADASQTQTLQKKHQDLAAQRRLWNDAKNNPTALAILSGGASEGVKVLYQLMDQFQGKHWIGQDSQTREEMTTVHLAQILTNRKTNFSNANTPGAYRYYSASHPDPSEQGLDLVTWRSPSGGGLDIERNPQMLADEWANITVQGYVRTPNALPGTYQAEARLDETRPVRGILIETAGGSSNVGEVVPTSEIYTFSFSAQIVEAGKDSTINSRIQKSVGLGTSTLRALSRFFTVAGIGKDPLPTDTSEAYFKPQWNDLWSKVWGGVVHAIRRFREYDTQRTQSFAIPEFRTAYPSTPTSASVLSGLVNPQAKTKKQHTVETVVSGIGSELAKAFQESLSTGLMALGRAQDNLIREGRLTQEGADLYATALVDHIASHLKVPLGMGTDTKQLLKDGKHQTTIWTPVFPVSDARGYEVVGSFQYGRGLDIEPGSVWDALRAQDPLSVLDQKTVDNLISALIRGEAVTVEVEKILPGGQVVREKQELSGNAARGALEKKALATLRRNYSDQQLLDLGLLTQNKKDPTNLQFNMMNWISTQKEGVHKLPVVNAALSLADLTYRQDGKICNCRASEASVKLEAFANEGFLAFAPSGAQAPAGAGNGSADRATEWLQQQVLQASVPHKTHQDTLRGTALARPQPNSLQSTLDVRANIVQGSEAVKQRVRALEQAQRNFQQAVRNISGGEEGG